jgi:hypothetical protein
LFFRGFLTTSIDHHQPMTWIIGSPTLFGYAAGVSDIQVTWPDGRTADCLLKVYPVATNIAAGFSGSVQAGFWLLGDLAETLRPETRQGLWFLPRQVAVRWHRRARKLFSQLPSNSKRSSLMLFGVSPVEDLGIPGWARSDVIVLDSSRGFEPVYAERAKAVSIGSGSGIGEYSSALEKTIADKSYFEVGAMLPGGGVAWWLANSVSRVVRENPKAGISSSVLYTVVQRAGISTHPHEFTEVDLDGTKREFRLPWIAKSWDEFKSYSTQNGLACGECHGRISMLLAKQSSPTAEDLVHRVGGLSSHGRQDVAVQVHRYPDAGMPQQVRDHLRRDALSE